MKRFALTLAAASLAAGSVAAPALADGMDTYVDTTVVSVDRDNGRMNLANGTTLDQSIEWFAIPPQASAGDKVRVIIDHNNDLDRVVVLR
ncbi:MAG: hypothetical protein JJ908_08200 [Rhizobiales bacterium]|nr:hypothetical protein [Hyphomicrobiales bacterium]MBO6697410.1 hypothetical protein [Hyphomicrobiales bacterium]MBO6736335.1 hypothetical protein [Hyphomicrobiales bacterium]MBO6912805.1 hypothetical protein [Hyphomicrobiales bacterium]MBO6953973.1 hypothetical protein [Hyphomicrobiales bacterium]